MTDFSVHEAEFVQQIASALLEVEITDLEKEHMQELYAAINGLAFEHVDSRNRPRSKWIQSSSKLGSKIKHYLGGPESHYGMNYVGYGQGNKWFMTKFFRAAIDQSQLFHPRKEVAVEHPTESVEHSRDETAALNEIFEDGTLTKTQRVQLIQARIGQGVFRENVALASSSCRLTGVSDSRFLRASHIKPWRNCTNFERLDGNNGLMLAPHVDHLFDQGFISFEADGTLLVSQCMPEGVLKGWSLTKSAQPVQSNKIQAGYLEYHREHVFKR